MSQRKPRKAQQVESVLRASAHVIRDDSPDRRASESPSQSPRSQSTTGEATDERPASPTSQERIRRGEQPLSAEHVNKMITANNASLLAKIEAMMKNSNPDHSAASAPRTGARSTRPIQDEADEDEAEFGDITEDDLVCNGPDGQTYALQHALEYLTDLPQDAFGMKFQGIAKPLQRSGAILLDAFRDNKIAPQTAVHLAESFIYMAGFVQHLAEHASSSDKELAYLAQLLDARRARLPIAAAMGRIAKLVKGVAPVKATPAPSAATSRKREPVGPCPRCGGTGHWGRDCPKFPKGSDFGPLVKQSQ